MLAFLFAGCIVFWPLGLVFSSSCIVLAVFIILQSMDKDVGEETAISARTNKGFGVLLVPLLYFENVGKGAIEVCANVGRFGLFVASLVARLFGRFYARNLGVQLLDVFFFSVLLIAITGFFSGAVLSLQSYNGLQRFGATTSVPAIVVLSLARELSPVLTALMIAGRVGSRIGAEIGGMAITSQIVAMRFLGVSPLRFLVIPRVLAVIISMPVLSFLFTVMGSIGGYIVCTRLFDFDGAQTINTALDVLDFSDVSSGLIKATVFGGIIGTISSYLGYNTTDGATGIGSTTTNSVVISSMLILLANYVLTNLLFH